MLKLKKISTKQQNCYIIAAWSLFLNFKVRTHHMEKIGDFEGNKLVGEQLCSNTRILK